MTTSSRKRGRPFGSGFIDDPLLARVAELLIDAPLLAFAAAVRQLEPGTEDHVVRRLRIKWRRGKGRFIAMAQARRRTATPRPVADRGRRAASATHTLHLESVTREAVEDPLRQLARLLGISNTTQAMTEAREGRPGSATRELRTRMLEGRGEDMASRVMREMRREGHAARTLREATENVLARARREAGLDRW